MEWYGNGKGYYFFKVIRVRDDVVRLDSENGLVSWILWARLEKRCYEEI